MRTIRLLDNAPHRRLPFGSSEWAADSCLAEWSQFERDWLGPDPRQRTTSRAKRTTTRTTHTRPAGPREAASPLAAACAGVAAGALFMVCWSLLGTIVLP